MTQNQKPQTIDEYIQAFPKNIQSILEKIRKTIHDTAPEAVEAISYQLPAFKLKGTNLIYFAAWKDHIAIYPTPGGIDNLGAELAPYQTGKGTLQFPLDKPIPYDLIQKIVQTRMQKI